MDLSVIIVSYNTKKLLNDCLTSVFRTLKETAISFEVIVVDNCSSDGTKAMLKVDYPRVRVIANTKNVGFGMANNQGIRSCRGEYVMLLNSDTIVLSQSISRLLSFTKLHPHCFVGPKLLNPDRTPQTSCGPFLTIPVVFTALFLRGDRLGLTRWSPNRTQQVDWVSGACFMAAKKLFLDDLLFDGKVFMYMEEIDLLYRARKKGYRTYFYPKSLIVHQGTGSSPDKRTPVINIYRGLVYFYKKHHGKISQWILCGLLRLKAAVAWTIGLVTRNSYLTQTYAAAYKMV